MNAFDEKYRLGMTRQFDNCEAIGEHQGDARTKDDGHGRWETWTCCDTREFLGELFDCDTCLEPGLCPDGAAMPTGWVEDTNGHHCPRCQP